MSQFARLNLRKSPVHLMIFECEPAGKTMFASPSHSEDQRGLRLVAALIAEVLDLVFIALSQIVKPQTISFRVHDGEQFGLQHLALGSVQHTLKDGVLDPLAVVDALPGDLPQAFAAGGVLRVHIIGNQYQHSDASLPQKGRVFLQVVPQSPGQQQRLYIGDQAPGDLLSQIGVRQFSFFPLLPVGQKDLAAGVRQIDRPIFPELEVVPVHDTIVD